MVRVGRHNFLILKKIQFACSQIKLLYLDHGALKNRPTSRAARNENLGSQYPCRVNQEITDLHSCSEVLALT